MKACFQPGQLVLFQGDSITDCGRNRSELADLGPGYPAKVAQLYNILFPDNGVTFVNRGISGNRSCNLLERYEADFASLKPDFICILIGINDVWRRYDQNDPTTVERFEQNYCTLLENLRRDLPDSKIMMMEPYLLPSIPERMLWREDLDPKIQAIRRLATDYADYYVPLDGILNTLSITQYPPSLLSADGVHPIAQGHSVIAYEWLKALEVL